MTHSSRHILFISLFFSTQLLAQKHFDYGKVWADKNFSCNTDEIRKEGTIYSDTFHSTGLNSICESKNELEIRFYSATSVVFSWRLFVITYNNGQWRATEYWNNFGRESYDKFHPIKVVNLKPAFGFDSLFNTLKQNGIFTLPDERTIKYELNYTDPSYNIITYKVHNKFRRYRILYPSDYKEKYPKIKTFESYDKLLDMFFNYLKRQE